jgi:hypothetical protein
MFYNIAMSQIARRVLFYLLFLLFIVLGIGISFYAQGWRMDLPSFQISKVGGIYVRSYPENAEIFLNGKLIKNQSGFLSRGTLISDLFPKSYVLALRAPGYADWRENATVLPSFVVNHKYAVLAPAQSTSISSTTATSIMAAHGNILIETKRGTIMQNGKTIGIGTLITVSPDTQSIIFRTAKGGYRFWNAANNTTTALVATGTLSIDPYDDNTVIAANTSGITLLNMSDGTSDRIMHASTSKIDATSIATSPYTIAWTMTTTGSETSSIILYSRSAQNILDDDIAIKGSVQKLAWITNNILGILMKDGEFYLYHTDQQVLQKTADDVKDFSATSDGSRIATLEKESFEVFTLNDPEGYYRFNLPNIASAEKNIWYHDDDHLFIVYPDHTSLLDLQDASLANFTTVAEGMSASYDPDMNALYLIDPHGLPVRFDFAK